MGAGTSKASSAGSQHVFASETPTQFSQSLIDSLQASSETDGTRAKSFELHIQERVAEELSRLQKREEQLLSDIQSKISSESSATPSSTSSSDASASSALSALLPGGSKKDDRKDLGRETILKDIEALKEKLGQRKVLRDVDKEVESAKAEVVKCLKLHDTRPLDCYREVSKFKDAVFKMEGKFVEGVMN